MTKLVYKGPSGIGDVEIYEGDVLDFNLNWVDKESIAFWSEEYSDPDYLISIRMPLYVDYSPDDCHTVNPKYLTKIHNRSKIKKQSGFGKWMNKIEGKVDDQLHSSS